MSPSPPFILLTIRGGGENIAAMYDPYNGLYKKNELAKIRKYLQEELERSLKFLKKPGKPKTYYLSYLFRNRREERLFGRLGSIVEHRSSSQNFVNCDLRVGSYRYDNVMDGGLHDNSEKSESIDYMEMPGEVHADSFKYKLWKLTDACYREAAEQYYQRKSRELHYVDANGGLASRVKRPPVRHWRFQDLPEADIDYWTHLIRKAGKLTKNHPMIKNSSFEFVSRHQQGILVNSEGSQILQQGRIFELRGHLWMLTRRGEGISQDISFIKGDLGELPSEKEFLRIIREKLELLFSLERAPQLNSYSGPVLLSPEACGLFFHEVIGHRLEGSRLLTTDDGSTFRDLLGKQIAPRFVDIVDDPTRRLFDDARMIGHFLYDDEGSPAKRAHLVEKGVLKSFLTTTSPIPGQRKHNGHARNDRHERPISRMGNLYISSRNPVSSEEMRETFLREIRDQKKPYGIHIKSTLGGETDTSTYDFQAFKGEITHAVRVFPDGKEEPVRDVDFVGTPLSALDAVMCLGDDREMDNSYCGAESGIVPVSTISPSMLMRNLELQSRDRERYTQYAMPLPF